MCNAQVGSMSLCFPFESKFIEVDGSTIHYVDEGKGDVTFLHAPRQPDLVGVAAVVKPLSDGAPAPRDTYRRIQRWCRREQVPLVGVDEIAEYIPGA